MKVLLFANIGGSEMGFYHAGDESMFFETYRLYRKHFPSALITVLSSYPSHAYLKINELVNLRFPEKNNAARIYFIKFAIKVFIWKATKKQYFHPEQFTFVKTINQQDRIHFTGGGNITSLFVHWLYYSLFIIFLGWILKKDIVLTSQTIGPFTGIDRLSASLVLNLPRLIGLRRNIKSKYELLKYGIFKPLVFGMTDAAYTLSKKTLYKLPPQKSDLRIGLSVHDWMDYGTKTDKVIVDLIQRISKKYKLEIILIPHLFTINPHDWDSGFMANISLKFPKKVKVINLNYKELTQSSLEPAVTIKYLSANIDILITSRYHGLIFALSENVPCMTFVFKQYYKIKNNGVLEMLYGANKQKYQIDLNKSINFKENAEMLEKIIDNLDEEKHYLKKKNAEINKSQLNRLLEQIITKVVYLQRSNR